MMQAAEDGRRRNAKSIWQLVAMWTCRNLGLNWFRDSRS